MYPLLQKHPTVVDAEERMRFWNDHAAPPLDNESHRRTRDKSILRRAREPLPESICEHFKSSYLILAPYRTELGDALATIQA